MKLIKNKTHKLVSVKRYKNSDSVIIWTKVTSTFYGKNIPEAFGATIRLRGRLLNIFALRGGGGGRYTIFVYVWKNVKGGRCEGGWGTE